MAQHTYLGYTSFVGTSGTSLTAITPQLADTSSPYFSIPNGSFTADGSGHVVTPGSTTCVALGLVATPADGNYDTTVVFTPSGSYALGLYLQQNGANGTISIQVNAAGTVTTQKLGGSGMTTNTQSVGTLTFPITMNVKTRLSGGTATFTTTINGNVLTPVTDSNPNPGNSGSSASLVDYVGGTTYNSFTLQDAPPTTATFSGPSTCSLGVASSNFTVTLNEPAGTGGQVISLASSNGSDTFQVSGTTVTSITIANGSTSGVFQLLAGGSAGARTITPTSSGITFSPSSLSVTASSSGTVTGVSVSPSSATVAAGGAQNFTATVTGTGGYSSAVTWSAALGAINSSGVYTAPAGLSLAQSDTVTATSVQDTTKSGTASVTIPAISGLSWRTSVQNFVSGLTGGVSSGFGYQVALDDGPYGSLITSGITTVASGYYEATFTVAAGHFVKAQWVSGTGATAIDTSPEPLLSGSGGGGSYGFAA